MTAPAARAELDACMDVIEQLCACMRAVAAHGVAHDEVRASAQACRRAIAAARPPFSLRFLSDAVLRGREPLPLGLGAFRRAQILARALYQHDTPELRFTELPKVEVVERLCKLFVEATQGQHRAFMPALQGIAMHKLQRVDPTSGAHDETDVDRVLRAALYGVSARVAALREQAARTGAWPWSEAQHAVAALERCLALGVTATARALELAAPEWSAARRGVAATTSVLTVLTRLRASDTTRRAAAHGMLAIATQSLEPPHDAGAFEHAARRALDALHRAPLERAGNGESGEPGALAPSPHRLRTLALVAACAGQGPPMALARLLHAAYALERKRIEPSGRRLSRIDLQAWLSGAIGHEIDDAFGRALLAALGALPPGSHVLCDGRLGVVAGPGKHEDRPIVLVGGALVSPDAPVSACSPLGMSPWAK